MRKIAIIGAGGFGREVKNLIEHINKDKKTFELVGFFEDNMKKGDDVNGLPVLGSVSSIKDINHELCLVLGIVEPKIKEKIIKNITNKNITFPNIIHPSVLISTDDTSLGKGNVICACNFISCNVELKNFISINLKCTVGHDTIINDFCSLMPSVDVSGEVVIEKTVYVGTGGKIINQLTIGENSIIGAGAVVVKTLPKNCTAVGIPAKQIKSH